MVAELRKLHAPLTLVCTGQHTDLLKGTPADSDLAASCSLNLPSTGDVWEWVTAAVPVIEDTLRELAPIAALVVQGDTMSAYAAALAAVGANVPLAHVEAGLRSHRDDEPFPEERIRKAIAQRADFHYCPTSIALENLTREKVGGRQVVTGNTVVSAISRYSKVEPCPKPEPQILITMHRREWTQSGQVQATVDALVESAHRYPGIRFLWPMHPGVKPLVRLGDRPINLQIVAPLRYTEALTQLARSIGVATDSGGLQEEAGVLGVPCAVLRNVTDRPESINCGVAKLFSPTPDGLTAAIRCLVSNELPRMPILAYGTPESARNIAVHLANLT